MKHVSTLSMFKNIDLCKMLYLEKYISDQLHAYKKNLFVKVFYKMRI